MGLPVDLSAIKPLNTRALTTEVQIYHRAKKIFENQNIDFKFYYFSRKTALALDLLTKVVFRE